jgi:periplasmic divalent cation tolerance protein
MYPDKKRKLEMDEIVVVETTVGNKESAKQIAEEAVKRCLVACCQSVNLVSNYIWNGNFEESDEVLLRMKTVRKNIPHLLSYIQKNHPYEVPEILVFSAESLSPIYTEWVITSTEGVE